MYLALLNVTAVSPLQKKRKEKTVQWKPQTKSGGPIYQTTDTAISRGKYLTFSSKMSFPECFFYFSLTALLQAQGSHNTQAASTDTSLEESSSSASDWCSFHNTMLVQDTQVMKSTDVHAHTEITACARCRCANHAFSHSLLIASIVGIVWERVSDLPRPV